MTQSHRLALILAAALLLPGCGLFQQERPVTRAPVYPVRDHVVEDRLREADEALNLGDYDAALAAFTAAIAENPRLTRAHMGMADIYRERAEWPQAERSYRRAVEIEPRNYDARYGLAFALHMLNRLTEAIREYRQALVIQPQSHEANLNVATAYLQLGQPAEALPFAEQAATLQPAHGPTRANLGTIYASVGNHERAVSHFQAALELMEPSPELVLNLVESLRNTKRHLEMVHTTEALIRMEPSPDAWERLGYAHFKLRQYPQSAAAYRAAIDMDGGYYPALNGLAVNLLNDFIRSNRADTAAQHEAVALLRRSLQIERDQPRIVELLSRYGR